MPAMHLRPASGLEMAVALFNVFIWWHFNQPNWPVVLVFVVEVADGDSAAVITVDGRFGEFMEKVRWSSVYRARSQL